MKVSVLILLLPCVVGFFWYLAYLLFTSKNVVYRKLTRFLGIFSFFMLFTILSQDESSRLMLHFILFKQMCALLMIPAFISYIKALQGKKPTGVFFIILSAVPYVQLVVGIESVFSVGFENALRVMIDSFTFQGPMFPYLSNNAEMVFYACYTYMFKAFLLADFMLFSVGVMSCAISGACDIKTVGSFFFKGKKAPLRPIQYFLALLLFLIIVAALILGKAIVTESVLRSTIGSVLVAVIMSLIAFVGSAGEVRSGSIPGILRNIRFGVKEDLELMSDSDDSDSANGNPENGVSLNQESQGGFIRPVAADESADLIRAEIASKLAGIVEGEEMYLKRDITLTAVADRLGVFKEALQDYIDYKYGMTFQNYINMLRVKYAEKYIMAHDHVTQNDIALACGFSGASSFNSAFSKYNGVTPKIWKDRQTEMHKNQES